MKISLYLTWEVDILHAKQLDQMHEKSKGVHFVCMVEDTGSNKVHALYVSTVLEVHANGLEHVAQLVVSNAGLFEVVYLGKGSW